MSLFSKRMKSRYKKPIVKNSSIETNPICSICSTSPRFFLLRVLYNALGNLLRFQIKDSFAIALAGHIHTHISVKIYSKL